MKEAFYSDYDGSEVLWSYAKTKEKAYLEMILCMLRRIDSRPINFDKVELERVYYCNNCEFSSSGENICCECGEVINKKGRHIYQYNLA